MFGLFKKQNNTSFSIVSTQNGTVVELNNVPDDVFAGKMLGDGVAVIPTDDNIVSPVDGTVLQVFDTLHAYAIHSDDGLDILVHIGINTVELNGEGFTALVKAGDHVKAGDSIATADIAFLKSKGYEIHTPIIITNMDAVKDVKYNIGTAEAGKTTVLTYTK